MGNVRRKYQKYYSHHQHRQHQSVGRTGQFQKSSPSVAEAAGENIMINPTVIIQGESNDCESRSTETSFSGMHNALCYILTRGKSSGSIQTMLRSGLSVLSSATCFRISRNSKPSKEWRGQQ